MATTDKRRDARPDPLTDPERLLGRRFLLGGLEDEAEGVRRYRVRRHETGPPLDLHLVALRADDADGNARFRRGVAAARALRHTAVQTLVEAGRLDDHHVYALVSARGSQSLDELLRRGPFPPGRAVAVLFQVAGALETLHRRGGSYGRLDAAHLSVTPRPGAAVEVRLLPATWMAAPGLSRPDEGLPPEGADAGPAGDLWQLGALARRMLDGGGAVPDSLERLIRSLLSAEPSRRPRSVYEVAVLLRDEGECDGEAPAIAPPMMVFTPIPAGERRTPIPTRLGTAVAFDVIRDAPPPRRPSSVRPAPRVLRHGNTPKPRGTPARMSASSDGSPPPIPTPVPKQAGQLDPTGQRSPEVAAFSDDVTTEVTIVPRLDVAPAGGGTRMRPVTFWILVSVVFLASAGLVPLLMSLLG